MQTVNEFGMALPADWRTGDEVIVPTAGSCGVAKERMESKEEDVHCYGWFFCTRKLLKETIENALYKKPIRANPTLQLIKIPSFCEMGFFMIISRFVL